MSSLPEFAFPGTPYPIQIEFMKAAYNGMSNGGICLLESPTGTGKSLSLICSSLAWLRDNQLRILTERLVHSSDLANPDVPTWISRQSSSIAASEATDILSSWKEFKTLMRTKAGRIGVIDSTTGIKQGQGEKQLKRKSPISVSPRHSSGDGEYLIGDYSGPQPQLDVVTGVSIREKRIKVIISSRTHSQLAQLLQELLKTEYKAEFNTVTLGSRNQLCVNPRRPTGSSKGNINDFCRESVDDGRCEFKNSTSILKQLMVSNPLDVEDLINAAKDSKSAGCAYYASREIEPFSDVVFVPHASLVNPSTRSALGLEIQDNIVVIDEAHNILDLINASRSVSLARIDMEFVCSVLNDYLAQFCSRLSPKNLVNVKQLHFMCRRLLAFTTQDTGSSLYGMETFMQASKTVDIDIGSILTLLEHNQFANKLAGFSRSKAGNDFSPSAIYSIQAFLQAIHTSCESDRIYVKSGVESPSIEFASIDAESDLAEIARLARAVLLVSGTLKPYNEYVAAANLSGGRITMYSAVHTIQENRLFSRTIPRSRCGEQLAFTAKQRTSASHVDAIVDILDCIIAAGPKGGVVVFTSSYAFCQHIASVLHDRWVVKKASIFTDSPTVNVIDLLNAFSVAVNTDSCAVLVSVVGGSLSEGIDFKDKLCRCVLLVGLPYPNPSDLVLRQRMSFYDKRHSMDSSFPTGQSYYEGKCIKAVNQAIGRSIRHANDWAAIILLDHRFETSKVGEGLSDWLKNVTKSSTDYEGFHRELHEFFIANNHIEKPS